MVNNTNLTFTEEEISLLNNGQKYNLHYKHTHWIQTLALEAENAITMLPTHEQEPTWYTVAKNIQHLYRQQDNGSIRRINNAKREENTICSIRENLAANNAMIVKSDKGNSVIVVYQQDCQAKILYFTSNNKFEVTDKDTTDKYQKDFAKLLTTASP
jgi:hypothetical protein